ncbi:MULTISPECIES: hypothetical protein [Bradyrhizobium]|uniref:Uncharacterized protein n=2 Tax=Bradyrhizobium TaxID=374 RepID=A0ABY0Q8C6_9BRAD|nr:MULTISPECIES: hypothetical protein [Bradyrhizobium]SDJ68740.1 hypothetical protein SAMN05444163_6161 [Bradyrhizobium ottawaense]SEC25462.1 hypothetical protein SAMN05444171_0998 [Bradyrhizobium lablabi]
MTKVIKRIALLLSCGISFNKPVLSQSTVRSVNASVLIERLAESVARMLLPTDAAGVGVSAKALLRLLIAGNTEREVA